jgi:hypothetical protein
MPEQSRNQGGQGLMAQLGKLAEALEKVVFRTRTAAPEEAREVTLVPPDGQRLLRGLGEALERIAAREADEAAARPHASS